MQELAGQRKGTKKYFYDGYFYHSDPRQPNFGDTFICSFRYTQWQCLAKAVTSVNRAVILKQEHCHPPMSLEENRRLNEFKNELKEQGRQNVDPPDVIYKAVREKFPDVAHLILQASAKMHIIREREKCRPKLPESFVDLGDMLVDYEPAEGIFRGQVVPSDNSSGVIFASVEMMDRLNDCVEIYVDGTFKCVPKGIGAKQLLILHIRKMNVGMASVFVLCTNQTTELYMSIWKFLLDWAPGLRTNLKFVMMDFERALIKSVKETMPWVTIRGCWFHFTKAISTHWQDLGLKTVSSTHVQDILSLAWVLPLLPAKDFSTAIEFYRKKADQVEPKYKDPVNVFIDYLENQWLRIAEIVSLWRSPTRTNNVCESFHGRLLKQLGHHPNLFVFIGKLASVIRNQEADWQHLEHDGNAVGTRCHKQLRLDLYINYQQLALLNGKLTVSEFLMKIKTKKIKEFIQFRLYSQHYIQDSNLETALSPQELVDLLGFPQTMEFMNTNVPESQKILEKQQNSTWQQLKVIPRSIIPQATETILAPEVVSDREPFRKPGAVLKEMNLEQDIISVVEKADEPETISTTKEPEVILESDTIPKEPEISPSPKARPKKLCCIGCRLQVSSRKIEKHQLQSSMTPTEKRCRVDPKSGMTLKREKKPKRPRRPPNGKQCPRYKLAPSLEAALKRKEKKKQTRGQTTTQNEPRYKFSPSFKSFLKEEEKLKAWLNDSIRLKNFVNSYN